MLATVVLMKNLKKKNMTGKYANDVALKCREDTNIVVGNVKWHLSNEDDTIVANGGGCVFARPLGEIQPLLPNGF